MGKKRKQKMQFRCYTMPAERPFLALLGQSWVRAYGEGIDYLHFHNYMEIGYCYEGTGELVLGDESYRFAGGEFSVIPQNYPHTTNSDHGTLSRWEYLFIDVGGVLKDFYRNAGAAWTERVISDINSRAVLLAASAEPGIAGLIRRILDIMRGREEFYLEEAKGLLAALLMEIARDFKSRGTGTPKIAGDKVLGSDGRAVALVSDAVDYIADHFKDPLRVSELADKCHISETHFRRMFSEYMEMGPLEYINLVRIQAACEYLKKTDRQIADIAHDCGFSTLSTFNRNFRQVMGVAPHEWRNRPENYEQRLLRFDIHTEEGW